MKPIKTLISLAFGVMVSLVNAQEIEKSLPSFNKILVSPKINLILQKGESESIRIRYSRIDPKKIHAEVHGTKLKIYLDDARMVDERENIWVDGNKKSVSVYENVEITAYVTYRQLAKLCVRGEEEVSVYDAITSEKFRLKAYGESEIELASLSTQKLKVTMYGENRLKIKGGEIGHQKLKLYGENQVDTRAIESLEIATTIYGEGIVKARASNLFHLNALGEPRVQLSGNAIIRKGIVIGTPVISSGLSAGTTN